MSGRRDQFKARRFLSDAAEKRRAACIERQSSARSNLKDHLRQLARPAPQDSKQIAREKFRAWKSSPLTIPDWMNDVPRNLSSEWYVGVRKEGKRCVVVAAHAQTNIRSPTGRYLRRGGSFTCRLPGGYLTSDGKSGTTVLDCLFDEDHPDVVHVLDVMVWNDTMLYDCSFEFREFWIRTRLHEIDSMGDTPVKFIPSQFCIATSDAVTRLYNEARGLWNADGLLFCHREGRYVLEPTPLVLHWKDANISKYVVEAFEQDQGSMTGNEEVPLFIVLSLSAAGNFETCDKPPISLGQENLPIKLSNGETADKGDLLRFRVLNTKALCFAKESEVIQLAAVEAICKSKSKIVYSWSRIQFQCRLRHDPLTIEEIMSTMSQAEEDME